MFNKGCVTVRQETFFCLVAVLFLALYVSCLYANTTNHPFIFDDVNNIIENKSIRITGLGFNDLLDVGLSKQVTARPVSYISFALNNFYHKADPSGYHLVNIAIHIITGVLLHIFVGLTLGIAAPEKIKSSIPSISFFTAFIWLVHPVQVQSVTYIVQRMNSMAAMFYLLSIVLYVKGRQVNSNRNKWLFFGGSVVAGGLSLGSKEIALTLPAFILLYEWFFLQRLEPSWARRFFLWAVPIAIFIMVFTLLYFGGLPFEAIMDGYKGRSFTMSQRVLTEFRVIIHYLSLLFFPHPSRLTLLYDFPVSTSLTTPFSTLLSFILLTGMSLLAICRAPRQPLLSFCFIWFLGNLCMESSVIALEPVYEHRNYLPSMLISLMFVLMVHKILSRRWLQISLLCFVIIMFSIWTHERNGVWADKITFWSDGVKKAPNTPRPLNRLGSALMLAGKTKEAKKYFYKALQHGSMLALFNLGAIYENEHNYEAAAKRYRMVWSRTGDERVKEAFARVSNLLAERARRREPHQP